MKETLIIDESTKQNYFNCKPIGYVIDKNGCHICVSHSRTSDGYPVVNRADKKWMMNRYIWYLNNGDIPKGLCVMHSCDNPNCINISHLSLGTHKENMDDRDAKGRMPNQSGFDNPNCSLTIEDVIQIKKYLIENNMRQIDIAKKFNVHRTTISEIQRGVRWSEVEVDGFKPIIKRNTPVKLTDKQVLEILMNENKLTNKQLSVIYKVAPSTISNIRNSKYKII